MPNVNDLKTSKYLKKEDVDPERIVTIKSYSQENVALETQSPEMKYILHFNELPKPLVLNYTNGQLIQQIVGSGDFDHWVGKQICLYNDPTVSFGGKITGGIRAKAAASPQPAQNQGGIHVNPNLDNAPPDGVDDLPF